MGGDIGVNGRAALEEVTLNPYDLILIDCQMPVMDGFDATSAIRNWEKTTWKRVPILALTANAMKSVEEAYLDRGMDGFLTKPIKRDILIHAIEEWTTHRSARTVS
ncbi:MAG: response regulator [Cryobacterium sp.]|nr:response regulator [Oligoflexia bacterium]